MVSEREELKRMAKDIRAKLNPIKTRNITDIVKEAELKARSEVIEEMRELIMKDIGVFTTVFMKREYEAITIGRINQLLDKLSRGAE